jgi:hypothetical protein
MDNTQFTDPYENTYLSGYAIGASIRFDTLADAQEACLNNPTAAGITWERDKKFTLRSGSVLCDSEHGERSWLKKTGEWHFWILGTRVCVLLLTR